METVARFDTNLPALAIKQHHETAKHTVMATECFERGGEGCFQIACVREQATDLEKGAELPHFAPFARDKFRTFREGSNHGWRILKRNLSQVKVKSFIAT